MADIDSLDENSKHVMLMTIHSAKGLEFPVVFMTGLEDGLFPSYMSIVGDDRDELEEERRLCYVGITRAKKELYLSSARVRMVRGESQYNKVSRFVKEIPEELLDVSGTSAYDRQESIFAAPRKRAVTFTSAAGSYMDKPKAVSFNPSESRPNTKVGFGKEFPSGIFDLKKPEPLQGQSLEDTKTKGLSYDIGDRVLHSKFGAGIVSNIVEGARDYEVTVDFDGFGRKKLLAGFAKLKKC